MIWLVQSRQQPQVVLPTLKFMKRTYLFSLTLVTFLVGCTSTPIDDSFSGVNPLNPGSLLLGHDVGNFWTIPAKGNPNVLVVPIEFSDLTYDNPSEVVDRIDEAFNGESGNTFQSQKSFYETSSFNQLSLTGIVTEPFQTEFSSSYYENLLGQDPNTVIIDELMEALDASYDFSSFDLNEDNQLDGLYMIYNHPAGEWSSFWWAYLYSYFGNQTYDQIMPTSYVWMPYEFVFYNNQIDASTFIHETGHKLGLEDYYDYGQDDGSGNEFGLGGADMMDGTAGDHNPFSKLTLGWIEPKVANQSMDVVLRPYSTSGDALIITDAWDGSLFDEYLIAIYYTPTGLYEGWDDFYFDGRSGMVLYHVDARLGPNLSDVYPTHFLNNNSDSDHKLIRFIEADGNNSLYNKTPTGWMWEEDVYRPGHAFGINRNLNYAWNQTQRGNVPFTIRVNQEAANMANLSLSIRF